MGLERTHEGAIPADHLSSVLQASAVPSLVLRDVHGELTIVGANEHWAALCGSSLRDLMRRSPAVCMSDPLVELIERHVADGLQGHAVEIEPRTDVLVGGARATVTLVGVAPRADQRLVVVHALPVGAEAVPGTFVDWHGALAAMGESVLVLDRRLHVVYANPAAERLLGWGPDELVGTDVRTLAHPEAASDLAGELARVTWTPASTRLRLLGQAGRTIVVEASLAVIEGPDAGIVVTLHDLTNQQRHEETLAGLSAVDTLTGLSNRQTFVDHIDAIADAERDRQLTVAFLDLDNFKPINDALGHDHGDAVLRTIARRLDHAIGSHGVVARFGGDEFVVATEAEPGAGHDELLYLLGLAFADPVELDGKELMITVSIGIASTTDPDAMQADAMLKAADIAMYEAKRQGKNCVAVYDESLEHQAAARIEIASDLRQAIEGDQLELHYQPIIDVMTGRVVGAEALLRWFHPERGMVPPDTFIPIAEQNGLIVPIGAWVLDAAIAQTAAWNSQRVTRRALGVSVNLSAAQLGDPSLEQRVHAALSRHGFDPARLTLEITESTLMTEAAETMVALERLRDLGVRIAIDDFGTGYSSLAYLKRLPARALKVDKAFIDGLGLQAEDTALVTGIVGLASALDFEIVAEGVETERQLKELRRLGCEYSQGYYHSRPLPAAEFETWVNGREPTPPRGGNGTAPESTERDATPTPLPLRGERDLAAVRLQQQAGRANPVRLYDQNAG